MGDLNDIVAKVIGWAEGDEQVEAYAAHTSDASQDVSHDDMMCSST